MLATICDYCEERVENEDLIVEVRGEYFDLNGISQGKYSSSEENMCDECLKEKGYPKVKQWVQEGKRMNGRFEDIGTYKETYHVVDRHTREEV